MKPRVWLFFPLFVVVGLLFGCIDFEKQTMSWRHDAAADTLYIYQDYQGIFGGEDSSKLSQDEKDQLDSVIKTERTFFFGNWITEYNRSALTEALAKPKGEIEEDARVEEVYRAAIKLALDNVKVENVGLYKDKQGRLCGAQKVTIRNISKVLPGLNVMLREYIRMESGKDGTSDAERALARKFAERGEKVFTLEGNQLQIRWPLNREAFDELQASAVGKALAASGGKAELANDQVIVKAGEPKAETSSVTLPFATKPYAANALGEAKQYGIKEAFDSAKAVKEFFATKSGAKP